MAIDRDEESLKEFTKIENDILSDRNILAVADQPTEKSQLPQKKPFDIKRSHSNTECSIRKKLAYD